jgi:hypothetical protein
MEKKVASNLYKTAERGIYTFQSYMKATTAA